MTPSGCQGDHVRSAGRPVPADGAAGSGDWLVRNDPHGPSLTGYERRYLIWYHGLMPGLNITFSDDELESVREAAGREGLSLKAYAHKVVVAVASSDRIADIAASVAARSKELNERLAH